MELADEPNMGRGVKAKVKLECKLTNFSYSVN